MLMSKKICRSHPEWEELGHYCIEKFMVHERAEELIEANRAMNFISGIMHRSFHSVLPVNIIKISDKRIECIRLPDTTQLEFGDIEYNHDQDLATDAIQTILEEMILDKGVQWFRAGLFQKWVENPNYSKLERETDIPRTSIKVAVEEAKEYIRQQLKDRGIDYEL